MCSNKIVNIINFGPDPCTVWFENPRSCWKFHAYKTFKDVQKFTIIGDMLYIESSYIVTHLGAKSATYLFKEKRLSFRITVLDGTNYFNEKEYLLEDR